MGIWKVDGASEPGLLQVLLSGRFTATEMSEFARANAAAVEAFGTAPYRVFNDASGLAPLSPDCAAILEEVKQLSSRRANFQGSAVLISAGVVALQHRRTSRDSGVLDTELITDDRAKALEFLRTVKRR